ncbi:DUF427 domain-containing protein [Burkholderia plantarii]|uniref:DUF427 domain-containing protein n=1 Tax=Burkholderia plantarii TaxID=41899 RepID=A0A0B6S440_BURPL|nr:DUF427 domain-containing protein [Burkholderia plantarii]AJK50428.1 hypothetical protein DUF427 [Burkholderia plantarii]ALK34607.1 hypothetical protein bpln_2g24020 [Burkholderia plantarii]WLE63628.1 DUF427 domain-containing protein [Burkholderia plantarii]GLZ22585.1 hypothetical protein Bpla01_61140 [Burkholderia plantarii]
MSSSDRPVRVPGPDHPISIAPTGARVLVKAGAAPLADTHRALTLREAAYEPVQYVPRADVDLTRVERSTHTSYCPYKGEAVYYSIPELGKRGENAIWSYETPYDAVAPIAGHFAFYTDRVDAIEIAP